MIPIFANNQNTYGAGNDHKVGPHNFDSIASCVQAVKDDCPWANIANFGVKDGEFMGCWCQYGDDYTDDPSTGPFKNCLLGPIEDFAGPASS